MGSVKGYNACSGSKNIFFSIDGATHFEPVDSKGAGREDEPTALFLACHLRDEHCPQVYGPSGDAICAQPFKLNACKVSEAAVSDVRVVAQSTAIPSRTLEVMV